MGVVFFLSSDVTPHELSHIEERIKASPYVVRVSYVSRQQAFEKFEKNFPELQEILRNLGTNPFPPSFEATLQKDAFRSNDILGFIEEIKNITGVEDVQFNREWVQKIQSLSRLTRAIGFFLGGILILASFFIISNVIRLNVLPARPRSKSSGWSGPPTPSSGCRFSLKALPSGSWGACCPWAFSIF